MTHFTVYSTEETPSESSGSSSASSGSGGGGGGTPSVPACRLAGGNCLSSTQSCSQFDQSSGGVITLRYHPVTSSGPTYGGCLTGEVCCIPCGNNRIDPNEQCDDTQLGGATCVSLGFPEEGQLSCKSPNDPSYCQYDTGGCGSPIPPNECVIAQTCTETTILKTTGNYNAHANLVTADDSVYPYKVCCNLGSTAFSPQLGTGHTSASGIIGLMAPSGPTSQRHAGSYSTSSLNEYVYLEPTSGTITCATIQDTAGLSGSTVCTNAGYQACMFTLTDTTNAHIADCSRSDYQYKVCCKTN